MAEFDPRFDPSFQRGFAGRPAQPVERVVETPDAAAPVIQRRDPVIPELPLEESDEGISLSGNPWVRALWVIAGVFTIGGLVAQWQAQQLFSSQNGSNAIDYYVLPSILSTMSPWFTFAGLIAGVAVVTLHAVRWRQP